MKILWGVFFVAATSWSQVWVQEITDTQISIHALAVDARGNCYISGLAHSSTNETIGFGTTNLPLGDFMLKYDASGKLVCAQHTDGARLLASSGQRTIGASGNLLFEIEKNGDLGRSTSLGSPSASLTAISASGPNTFLVAGYFSEFVQIGKRRLPVSGTVPGGPFVASIRANGKTEWIVQLPVEWFRAAIGTRTGGAYVLTDSEVVQDNVLKRDVFGIIALNPHGKLVWTNEIPGDYTGAAYGIASDRKGNCFVTGHFFGEIPLPGGGIIDGRHSTFAYSFDRYGQPSFAWMFSTGASDWNFALDVAADRGGNWYTGVTFLPGGTGFDGVIVKNGGDDAGVPFGGTGDDWLEKIVIGQDNALYAVGRCTSYPTLFGATVLTNSGTFVAKFKLP